MYIYCIWKSVLTVRQPRQRLDWKPKQFNKGIHFFPSIPVVSYLYLSKQRGLRSDYAMKSMIWAVPFCMHTPVLLLSLVMYYHNSAAILLLTASLIHDLNETRISINTVFYDVQKD